MELKGFTLVEVLVSLLLLGIIGTFAFFISSNSQTAFNAMHTSSIERDSFLRLSAYMHRDTQVADQRTTEDDGTLTYSSAAGVVSYVVTEDSTIRLDGNSVLRFETSVAEIPNSEIVSSSVERFQMRTAGKERNIVIRRVEDVLSKVRKEREDGN